MLLLRFCSNISFKLLHSLEELGAIIPSVEQANILELNYNLVVISIGSPALSMERDPQQISIAWSHPSLTSSSVCQLKRSVFRRE